MGLVCEREDIHVKGLRALYIADEEATVLE